MNWLPTPLDFRGDLRAALAVQARGERLEKLSALAQHRLGYMETIQCDRALGSLPLEESFGFSTVRLAVLSSSTVDHLVPGIRVAGLRRRLLIETHIGQYGQYRQELFDNSSPLHDFAPQIVLFSLTAREAIGKRSLTASATDVEAVVSQSVETLRVLWRKAREIFGATVIQQTFLNFADLLFGSYERLVPGSPAQLIVRLNDRLAEVAAAEGVMLLDIARASERGGLDAWFDTALWFQGKLEIAPPVAPLYGELVGRVIGAQRGLSKKCLVLDLDNTLWGGVVGDDGIEGIVLGEGSASGEAHLALQHYAKHLRDRGVILAVCSKNEPQIAEEAFSKHPEMHLKRGDIAAFFANWNPKAENLRLIAAQLNIGLDSLVFVDDNPVERASIREALPMVAVPELPSDTAQYVRCLADAGYFEAVAFTQEDQQRGEQYAANISRESSRESSQSLEDFLRGLEMKVVFSPVRAVDLVRVVQLINKTNQFNPTTRRHSLDDMTKFVAEQQNLTLQFRLLDKFGDNGLISAMILRPDALQTGVLEIDTWVMSCRVFGRQLEFEAMNIAVELARQRGARGLLADYIPTAKNGVVKDIYPSLGFISVQSDATDSTRWFLDLSQYQPYKTYITRRAE